MALVTLNKQLLDEVFVICRIINVEVRVIETFITCGENHKLNPIIVLS